MPTKENSFADITFYAVKEKQMNVVDEIGAAAVYEQLAEECAEAAKEALKVARILRKENPTPVTKDEALEHLEEELSDILICVDELVAADEIYHPKLYPGRLGKIKRWFDRIAVAKGKLPPQISWE